MFKIALPADRSEPDMVAVASAFGISVRDLMDGIRIGTISRWTEVGTGDADNKPHQIFTSRKLATRVAVDEYGNVHSVSEYGTVSVESQPDRAGYDDAYPGSDTAKAPSSPDMRDSPDAAVNGRLDALLDLALEQSFPASDPIAICIESPQWTAPPSSTSGSRERRA